MLSRPPKPSRPIRRKQAGFALVITVMLMVLLAMLALGLLSLSSVSLRSSSHGELAALARSNARLSLNLAIGRLQQLAGSDQRITAGSGILDDHASPSSTSARPHLTGVWKSWKWDMEQTPDYDSHKQADFLGWLVSSPDEDATSETDFALNPPSEDAITMVPADDFGSNHVLAEPFPIGSDDEGQGAWVVLDQGQKACITLPDVQPSSLGEELALQTAPASPGFGSVTSGGMNWSSLSSAGSERQKLISTGQISLLGIESDIRNFHHLAPYSTAIPVDVAEGGLAKDLSLAFEHESLPSEFERKFVYSDGNRPLVNPASRFSGAHVMPSPDPSWDLLHSHARLHREVRGLDSEPTIGTQVTERPQAGLPAVRTIFHPHFNEQQIAPVIAKAQFVFSIGFGASPRQASGGTEDAQKEGENWVAWLITDPVITLWNPYDVSLTFERARVDLHRIPLAFHVYRNGVATSPNPTLFANSYLPGDFNSRAERYYRLNILPELDSEGEAADKIVMKPGEHLVFSAHNHMPHYLQRYMLEGVDLRPGWHAPAGESSRPHVGGVSSLNLCVSSTGQDSGRINGVTTRVVPVKAGDTIALAVSPASANIDKFSETNGEEITSYLKYYVESDGQTQGSEPPLVGAIELDYDTEESRLLPSYSPRDLPSIVVPGGMTNIQGDSSKSPPPPNCRHKEPFLVASMHLKTAQDSREPSRSWLHNSPTNLYASAGLDQEEDEKHHQYEFSWEAMTDWTSSPTIEIDGSNRGFGASGIYAQTGQTHAPFSSIPLAPLTSMAQLRHAPINTGGQLPLQAQAVGNSLAHPLLPATSVRSSMGRRTFVDHSFLANHRLFDRYFFSSLSSQSREAFGKDRSLLEVTNDFLEGSATLPNPRIKRFHTSAGEAPEASRITNPETGYKEIAAHLGIHGAFNVNSTSVAAWEAILSSLQPSDIRRIATATGVLGKTGGHGTLVSRHVPPLENQLDGASDPEQRERLLWQGHRRLSDYQISEVAEELVRQIRLRGPFQSTSEFVNRRVASGEMGVSGALQAAIDRSSINNDALAGATPIPADPTAAFPEATVGTSGDGAPAVINQADLLTPLAPLITVRSDTFVIRAYGEAGSGENIARAWCEATLQRFPNYLDASSAPETHPDNLDPSGVNARFGRRFNVISFRWLSPLEM